MTHIVVLDGQTLASDDNPWDDLRECGDVEIYPRSRPDEVAERARGAQIVITNKAELPRATIMALPDLRAIAVTATGYNIVDVAAARERGIPVSNVPIYSTDSVAQFTIAMLLAWAHRIEHHSDLVHAGEWTRSPDFCFWRTPQVEWAGKTLGIIGFGRIGRRVGEIAHALGMRVVAFSRTNSAAPDYQPFAWAGSLEELAAASDVIALHCPQTPENTGFINAHFIGHMKKGAVLINASRGGLVNEQDLAEALNSGRIAGAAVDVVSREPMQAENPLLSARNCIITPHMAWTSLEARRRLMTVTVDNVRAFLAGHPTNVVNP